MSAASFACCPEVRALPTHVYIIDVPDSVWNIPKPEVLTIFPQLWITALVPGLLVYDGTGRTHQADGASMPIMKAYYDSGDYQVDAFTHAMRELGGHHVPFSVYDPQEGMLIMKLATPDEQQTPRFGIHPSFARF